MLTALDADPEDLHPDARDFVDTVRKFDWAVTHVYADENAPSFTYTTGLWVNFGVPEVILFALPQDVAHGVLIALVDQLRAGERHPFGAPVSGLIGNFDVYFFEAEPSRYADYLLRSIWFYDDENVPCQQLVFPDLHGKYSWQEGVDPSLLDSQPNLTGGDWGPGLLQ